MAIVLSNIRIEQNVYLIKVYEPNNVEAGQFYMLMPPKGAFTLRRPFSVHDASPESISFLYRVQGRGTNAISQLEAGELLDMYGPFGKGYPLADKDSVFVGGGMGCAPLYLALKQFKLAFPHRKAACFLGFSAQPFLENEFKALSDSILIQSGGLITQRVVKGKYNYYACGPENMLRALGEHLGQGAPLFVSLERRMGCGVGACFSCSIHTKSGNRRICKEGPVFNFEDLLL